jgi:hypothetical protein
MNNFKRWLPVFLGLSLVAALLVGVWLVSPARAQGPGWGMIGGPGWGMMGGRGMMGDPGLIQGVQGATGTVPFGPGWMHGWMMGPGGMMGRGMMGPGGMMGGPGWMMQGAPGVTGTVPFGPGWMMGGEGMMGDMMVHPNSPFYQAQTVEPLTLAETTETLEAYLAELGDDNLEVREVMIFDNHAYAEIAEIDSGIGVMEVLVDPTTRVVYPEMGPNMMWNLRYGMMSGFGRYGMMGQAVPPPGGAQAGEVPAEMPISGEQAIETAQTYLDTYYPNLSVAEEAEPFYGYYTLHVEEDGEAVGMLSVNGYTGQVFPKTWTGELLEMKSQ